MSLKPDQSGMVEVLSQALRESQGRATRLEIELQSAVAISEDLKKQNLRLSQDVMKLSGPKHEPVEDSKVPVISDEISRLEENNAELRTIISTLNTKVEEIQEGLEAANKRKVKLEVSLTKAQEELKAGKEHITELTSKYSQSRQKKKELQGELKAASERVDELEGSLIQLHEKYAKFKHENKEMQQELQSTSTRKHDEIKALSIKLHDKLKTIVLHLPLFSPRPKTGALLVAATARNVNILDFLREKVSFESYHTANFLTDRAWFKAPSYHWFDQSIFYIPTGLAPVGSKQHYLRYHPVSEIIPNSEFQVGPSYNSPGHGPETRELFTQSAYGLKYLGLYKRFFDDSIAFTGMMLPSSMPDQLRCVLEEAVHSARGSSNSGFPSRESLQDLYRNGTLKVQCAIYQCVGFNKDLYTTLTQYESREGLKRKRPESGAVVNGKDGNVGREKRHQGSKNMPSNGGK
ncbi:hypothetical protein C8J55DRAFT_602689 [Lentinula edodes]|uniref:Uncharacterized protein n=1 Tax=Lentinula lateritia TaxID=40482 RepID=A0A9W9DZI0_9AGAR|nr:hypothetical protein C8J55DRAFT_602689 [Lentinula edodes]